MNRPTGHNIRYSVATPPPTSSFVLFNDKTKICLYGNGIYSINGVYNYNVYWTQYPAAL